MALTRDFKEAVGARARRDPSFATALLDEAATLFLNGEPTHARLILRDLVNATIGFEMLASKTDMPPKSLHRMLSARGNPSMDNLAAIFKALRKKLKVGMTVQTVAHQLVAEGGAHWTGGRPTGARRPAKSTGRTASAIVIEDRR